MKLSDLSTIKDTLSKEMCLFYECMSGGNFANFDSVDGIGNAVPPTENSIGSGDRWDNSTSNKKTKKDDGDNDLLDHPQTNEEQLNPYDKIGEIINKKLKTKNYFVKGKKNTVKQLNPSSYKIKPLK